MSIILSLTVLISITLFNHFLAKTATPKPFLFPIQIRLHSATYPLIILTDFPLNLVVTVSWSISESPYIYTANLQI